MKKIAIIGPAYPYRGGIADTNQLLALELMKKGYAVKMYTFTLQYPEFLFPGKTQFSNSKSPENLDIVRTINSVNPISWIKTAREINNWEADIVLVRYWMTFLSPSLGTIAKFLDKKIQKIALCDNVIPHEKRFGDKFLTKYFCNQFDNFITMSHTTFGELNDYTSKPKKFIPHPIFTNFGEKIDRLEARQKLGLDSSGKYLLFFGLIRDYKGLDLTLKALSHLEDKSIKLLVVGEFYSPIEKYLNLINELGIKDRVQIVNEFVPDDEVKNYFSACDLVVQTYHTASQSGVSQIAFNFDAPMLVTDVGGLSEIVIDGKMGYVCQKDPVEIAEKITVFFENNEYDQFSKEVSAEKEKYTWSTFADKLTSFDK